MTEDLTLDDDWLLDDRLLDDDWVLDDDWLLFDRVSLRSYGCVGKSMKCRNEARDRCKCVSRHESTACVTSENDKKSGSDTLSEEESNNSKMRE